MIENTGLSDIEIEKIKTVFAAHPEIEHAILYGSRAKGTYRSASDIDITLVGKNLNLTIQQSVENQLDDLLLPYKFDVSIFHQIENKDLIQHIERVGKTIFSNQ